VKGFIGLSRARLAAAPAACGVDSLRPPEFPGMPEADHQNPVTTAHRDGH
jgi:hypothetical protein